MVSHFCPLQKVLWPWEGPRGTQLSPDPQALLPTPPPKQSTANFSASSGLWFPGPTDPSLDDPSRNTSQFPFRLPVSSAASSLSCLMSPGGSAEPPLCASFQTDNANKSNDGQCHQSATRGATPKSHASPPGRTLRCSEAGCTLLLVSGRRGPRLSRERAPGPGSHVGGHGDGSAPAGTAGAAAPSATLSKSARRRDGCVHTGCARNTAGPGAAEREPAPPPRMQSSAQGNGTLPLTAALGRRVGAEGRAQQESWVPASSQTLPDP